MTLVEFEHFVAIGYGVRLSKEQAAGVASEVRRLRSELEAARGALREVAADRYGLPGVDWASLVAIHQEIARRALSSAGGGDAGKGEGA